MEYLITDLSILIVCAAILSSIAVIFKQPIIIAYILSGVIFGPYGIQLITSLDFIEMISHFGITLLLFLAGLSLQPPKLIKMFTESFWVTIVNCAGSFFLAFFFAGIFGFSFIESLVIGLSLMFSSTILAVKLLPTTQLHHERMGALCIGILILQDLIAVGVLAFTRCLTTPQSAVMDFTILTLKLILFIAVLILIENYLLQKVMHLVERLHEVLFILGLAWCFGIASISDAMGLFQETGAFFAGVVLARHPISLFISEKLKPLRDFFLVLFFFALGAKLDINVMAQVLLPAVLLAVLLMAVKAWLFMRTFMMAGETKKFSLEAGIRLGQFSEFSFLIALLALDIKLISHPASQLIQLVTIISFTVSSYLVVLRFPTPIGITEKLTKD